MNGRLTVIPDPFIYYHDNTTTTFYGYGQVIQSPAATIVLIKVDAELRFAPRADSMGTNIYTYDATLQLSGINTSLILVPTERLTWGMWASAVLGMDRMLSPDLFADAPGREFSFNIKTDAYGGEEVGWGLLKTSHPPSIS